MSKNVAQVGVFQCSQLKRNYTFCVYAPEKEGQNLLDRVNKRLANLSSRIVFNGSHLSYKDPVHVYELSLMNDYELVEKVTRGEGKLS